MFMSTTLYVGNLSPETTDEEIRQLFSDVGPVESCRLMKDRVTGRSKSFAYVEMTSLEAANAVIVKFNGYDLHGKELKVQAAKPQNDLKSIRASNGLF